MRTLPRYDAFQNWLAQRQRNHGWLKLVKMRSCKLRFTETTVLPFLQEIWQQRLVHVRDIRGVSWRIHCVKGVKVEWEKSVITVTHPTRISADGITAKIVLG